MLIALERNAGTASKDVQIVDLLILASILQIDR